MNGEAFYFPSKKYTLFSLLQASIPWMSVIGLLILQDKIIFYVHSFNVLYLLNNKALSIITR